MGNTMSSSEPSIYRTLAQLFRVPAVFTSMSDVVMGAVVAWGLGAPASLWPSFLLLLLASSSVYLAGMVLNDVADVEIDRRERSGRPIPSGRISRTTALAIGGALIGLGLLLSVLVRAEGSHSFMTCWGLVLAVVCYDFSPVSWLRLLLMPACRFLNVLLGLSAAGLAAVPWNIRCYLAAVVAIYVLGITLFARNEAGQSNARTLVLGMLFMAAGLGLALAAPVLVDQANTTIVFPYLLVILAWAIAVPATRALRRPRPEQVQEAVRRALQGIIVLDASLACGLAGIAGLLILVLLIPNWYTGRWLSST